LFIQVDAVKVISSEDEEGKKGCRNVEQIVTDLHAEEENPRGLVYSAS